MNRYLLAGVITAAVLAVVFAIVLFLDDWRVNSLNQQLEELSIQSESNRVLFFYNQVFSPSENPAFCEVANKSATLRSSQGDLLFSKLSSYESANLFGDYGLLKKKYLLNRIELWLYTSLQNKTCNSNFVPILFFYRSKDPCPDCAVQGGILEELRNQCPNVKIFALATDEDIDLVPLIQAQFNVAQTPALVVNNEKVFERIADRNELRGQFNCGPVKIS